MGLSLEQFQSAAGSVGSILDKASNAWATVTGQTTKATTVAQPASPSVPSTPNQAIDQGATASGGLASIPPWLWIAGGIVAVMALRGRG